MAGGAQNHSITEQAASALREPALARRRATETRGEGGSTPAALLPLYTPRNSTSALPGDAVTRLVLVVSLACGGLRKGRMYRAKGQEARHHPQQGTNDGTTTRSHPRCGNRSRRGPCFWLRQQQPVQSFHSTGRHRERGPSDCARSGRDRDLPGRRDAEPSAGTLPVQLRPAPAVAGADRFGRWPSARWSAHLGQPTDPCPRCADGGNPSGQHAGPTPLTREVLPAGLNRPGGPAFYATPEILCGGALQRDPRVSVHLLAGGSPKPNARDQLPNRPSCLRVRRSRHGSNL